MKYLIALGAVVLVVAGYITWTIPKTGTLKNEQTPATSTDDAIAVVCTMDVKQCPDGSYVGRSGPNCEFAACPSGDTKYDFVNAATSTYVSTVDWPPMRQTLPEPYSCVEAGSEDARGGETKERTLTNGATYCITVSSEGAAGSIYKQYAYATSDGAGTVIDTFSLRFPQCSNYPEDKQIECKVAQSTFSVDDFYLHTSARR